MKSLFVFGLNSFVHDNEIVHYHAFGNHEDGIRRIVAIR